MRPEWLGDGAILVGGESATTVLSVDTGDVLFALTERGGTGEIEVLPGTTRVAIADAQVTETVIFDTSQLGGVEVGGWLAPLGIWRASYVGDGTNVVLGANLGEPTDQLTFITADADDGIEIQSVLGNDPFWWPDMTANGAYVPSPDSEGNWAVYSTVTGDPIYAAPEGWLIKGASWDGTKAVVHHFDSESTQCGPTRLVATVDGSVVATLADNECTGRATFAPSGEVVFLGFLPLGKPLHSGLFDANSGELLAELGDTPCVGLVAEFTPDSTELITGLGSLCVLDVEALKAGVSVDEAIDRHIPGHAGLVLRIAVSPDASEAATAALGEPVRWWDLHTGELLGEFGGSPEVGMHDADFHPSLPHLLVTTPLNEVRVHTLDIDELISIAESRLSRDMTEQECQQYFRTACDDA